MSIAVVIYYKFLEVVKQPKMNHQNADCKADQVTTKYRTEFRDVCELTTQHIFHQG